MVWTMVVKGLTMVDPAGALIDMVLGTPVSMLKPPVAMMAPSGALAGRKKLPAASVTPTKKSCPGPASTFPLAFTSIQTSALRIRPSATTADVKLSAELPAKSLTAAEELELWDTVRPPVTGVAQPNSKMRLETLARTLCPKGAPLMLIRKAEASLGVWRFSENSIRRPVLSPFASFTTDMDTTAGTTVSILKEDVSEAPKFPATSVATAVTSIVPLPKVTRSWLVSVTATGVAPAPVTVLLTEPPPVREKVTAVKAPVSAETVSTPLA